jgi:hypothetical protein
MSDRPAIPAEITREILLESGHRCAVCGTPCPLERAHIIPWHKSREHKAEDLICLCANCHERADKEKWGEKMLRRYKQKPWVLRHYESVSISPDSMLSEQAVLPGQSMVMSKHELLKSILRHLYDKAPGEKTPLSELCEAVGALPRERVIEALDRLEDQGFVKRSGLDRHNMLCWITYAGRQIAKEANEDAGQ